MNYVKKLPDEKKAQSLVATSRKEMSFTMSIELNDGSCSTIVRNLHESFRMLGKAILVSKGLEPKEDDHYWSIQELIKLNVKSSRPLGLLDNLRILRNKINYDGYVPSLNQVQEMILLAQACYESLHAEVLRVVERK